MPQFVAGGGRNERVGSRGLARFNVLGEGVIFDRTRQSSSHPNNARATGPTVRSLLPVNVMRENQTAGRERPENLSFNRVETPTQPCRIWPLPSGSLPHHRF